MKGVSNLFMPPVPFFSSSAIMEEDVHHVRFWESVGRESLALLELGSLLAIGFARSILALAPLSPAHWLTAILEERAYAMMATHNP